MSYTQALNDFHLPSNTVVNGVDFKKDDFSLDTDQNGTLTVSHNDTGIMNIDEDGDVNVVGTLSVNGTQVATGTIPEAKKYVSMEVPETLLSDTSTLVTAFCRVFPVNTNVANLYEYIRYESNLNGNLHHLQNGSDAPVDISQPTEIVVKNFSISSPPNLYPNDLNTITTWHRPYQTIQIKYDSIVGHIDHALVYGDIIVNLNSIPYFRDDVSNAKGLWMIECQHDDSIDIVVNDRNVYMPGATTHKAVFVNRGNFIRISYTLHENTGGCKANFQLAQLDKTATL